VRGEISPAYARIGADDVAEVHRLMPDARIIFLIRHPIERAWSNAAERTAKRAYFTPTTENLTRYFGSDKTQRKSDYLATLDAWTSSYPPDQVFLGFFEDIHFHPRELLGRIQQFLGVEPTAGEQAEQRVNHGADDTMPLPMARFLAELYEEELAQVAARFGGYAAWWAYVAERLREETDEDGSVTHPFYDGRYWHEWLSEAGLGVNGTAGTPPLQSNVLSELDRQPGALPGVLADQ
jgi:hypothetical protein